ncbi:MAG: (d)CMP kinase [Myxococcales bacterium]|nr:(d)CMP kinase [Myxococcales bacterium]
MPKRARVLVAIDGPAGAGKSTVARRVAERLDMVLVDTGALYRCVALAASRAGLAFSDEEPVGALAARLAEARAIRLEADKERGVRALLEGEDVSIAIRTPEMSLGASQVSAIPRVRDALLAMQRQAGEKGGVVLEGRDIGTVVFPDAEVKFFLTASPEERATRRHLELVQKGTPASFQETLADVVKRDKADTERPVAPLRQADDAIVIDSGGKSIEDVVDEMVRLVSQREAER